MERTREYLPYVGLGVLGLGAKSRFEAVEKRVSDLELIDVHEEPSYILYDSGKRDALDRAIIYAKNGRTGLVEFKGMFSEVLQNAIDSLPPVGGKIVIKSGGSYTVDTPITINKNGVWIEGEGAGTWLKLTIPNDYMFKISPLTGWDRCEKPVIRNMVIQVAVEQTGGGVIYCDHGFGFVFENLWVHYATSDKAVNHGIVFASAFNGVARHIHFYGVKGNALRFEGQYVHDIYCYDVLVDNIGTSFEGRGIGACILGTSGSIYIVDCDFMHLEQGIRIAPLDFVSWVWVMHTACDWNTYGVVLAPPATGKYGLSIYFDDCFMGSSSYANVLVVGGAVYSDVRFNKCRIVNAYANGVGISGSDFSTPLIFDGCTIASNSRASDGTYHGIFVDAAVDRMVIKNCIIKNDPKLGTGKQGYAIWFNVSGAKVDVIGNELTGNYTGALGQPTYNLGVVKGNTGYITENAGTATIASGTNSVTVNHGLSKTPSIVLITGSHAETSDAVVTGITSSQFTITVPSNVTENRTVYWMAQA
jgi:hypothetical protein